MVIVKQVGATEQEMHRELNFELFETTHFFYFLHHICTNSPLKKIAKNALYIVYYHKSKGWSLIIKYISASRNLAEEINKKELLVLLFFSKIILREKYDNTSWRQVRKGKFNWAEASHEQSVWLIHGSLYCLATLFPPLLDQIKEKNIF